MTKIIFLITDLNYISQHFEIFGNLLTEKGFLKISSFKKT